MSSLEVGAKVRYVKPSLGLVGIGVIDEIRKAIATDGLVYYVRLESKDIGRAPFAFKAGKTCMAENGKGTHRAFYAETLERIEA